MSKTAEQKPAAQKTAERTGSGESNANEVRLVGRLSAAAEERVLPSGDVLSSFRVIVDRPAGHRVRVDAVDCVAWAARPRRSAMSWRPGDVIEVNGALRRRFFRRGAGVQSMVEVEVRSGRIIRRAGA